MTTKKPRPRGRPRQFDPDAAVATAQQLFQARGYDAVSVADLTEALGVNPPSFYSAFGSKAGLYQRVLDRYAGTSGVPLADLLRPDRPLAEALAAVLEEAARRYAASGCLVLEGQRCDDGQARDAACALRKSAEDAIRAYIAARRPKEAERLTDFILAVMSGLSAEARNGRSLESLLGAARLASLAVAQALTGEDAAS